MVIKNIELGGTEEFVSGISTTFTEDLNDTFDRIATLVDAGN